MHIVEANGQGHKFVIVVDIPLFFEAELPPVVVMLVKVDQSASVSLGFQACMAMPDSLKENV